MKAGRQAHPLRRALGLASVASYRCGIRASSKLFSLCVAGAFDSFGANSVVRLPIRLSGERRISIGSRVFVGSGCWFQVLEGQSDGVAIAIGDGAALAGFSVLSAASSIRVGRNASLARNVYIADHTHSYDDPSRPIGEQGITDARPVEIGDGAWLGENVVVLPGVRIGKGAVVSANSVVTKDIPDHALAIGAPARVVRRFGTAAPADDLT
jgi:acetyltransferase-like isoleucine patch superfamily enzyme